MNINTDKIAKNFIVLNALLFLVGSLCTLPIISLLNPALQKLLIVFPFLMLILIHPTLFNKLFGWLCKNDTKQNYRYIFLFNISILYFFAYVILGLSLYFCALAFQSIQVTQMPLFVSALASSLLLGMLAVFAPAGIGVSESINTIVLSQIMPLKVAIMVVVALRVVMVIVDFSCALMSAVSIAREDKQGGA